MAAEIITIGSHYRDRADSENNFDELKNQWGWSGYTTSDLHRCRMMVRLSQVYKTAQSDLPTAT